MSDNRDILNEEREESIAELVSNIDWKRKLTSRKFWLAVSLFVSGIFTATGHKDTGVIIAGLIMQGAAVVAYIIGEGLTDAANVDMGEELPLDEVTFKRMGE